MRRLIASSSLLLLLASVALASFPSATNKFVSDLSNCMSAAQSDIDCLTTIQTGLKKVQSFIQDVHDVRTKLSTLSTALSTAKNILIVVDFIPAIGTAAKALEQTINVIKPGIDQASSAATSIDNKLWPYKSKVDSLLVAVTRAIRALTVLKQCCTDGVKYVTEARSCIQALPSGSVQGNLGTAAETFSSAIDPPTHTAVQAMATLGSTCSTLKSFVSLPWPDISSIKTALDSVDNALSPITSALQKVKNVLSQQVCLPISSPAELASEAKELGEEVLEKANPTNWFGKRKRGSRGNLEAEFTEVSASRQDAHSVLKRDWCVSVQDVINGANSALNAFLGPAQDLLNKALSGLPTLTLPGMPDLSSVLHFNLNFNVPTLDLGFDFTLVDPFASLNFQCPMAISASCTGKVVISSSSSSVCGQSLSGYAPTTTTTTTTVSPLSNWIPFNINWSNIFTGWRFGRR